MAASFCVLLMTLCHLQLVYGQTNTKAEKYTPLKYPGEIQDVSNRYGSLVAKDDDIPVQCRNKTFCTIKPANYPEEKFNAMFKGIKSVHQPIPIRDLIGDRQGDPDDKDNCETEISYEPLYKVRTKRGDWRTVVQAPKENYIQSVRLESCKEAESACFTAFPLAPDVTTYCKQKYSLWEFLVETEDGGSEKIQAELPVCCSCHYKTTEL